MRVGLNKLLPQLHDTHTHKKNTKITTFKQRKKVNLEALN